MPYATSRLIAALNQQFLATFGNGLLYNFPAVATGNLAPAGWHVPTRAELTTLTNYLGTESTAGAKLKITGTTWWNSPNTGATNESLFTLLGNGYRPTAFSSFKNFAFIWTNTSFDSTKAFCRRAAYNSTDFLDTNAYAKICGMGVRCIKDDATGYQLIDTVVDIDGNVYPTIKIGNQVWMASNLKTRTYKTGEAIPLVTDNTAWSELNSGACCVYANADQPTEFTQLWPII